MALYIKTNSLPNITTGLIGTCICQYYATKNICDMLLETRHSFVSLYCWRCLLFVCSASVVEMLWKKKKQLEK